MKWEPSEGQNKGTGTSGLCKHIKHKYPHQYDEAMKDEGSTAEKKAPVAAAIGKEMWKKNEKNKWEKADKWDNI